MAANNPVKFMDLPIEMIDKILSYLCFDEIAKLRGVNQTFNNVCSYKLNNGFNQLEDFHAKCMKEVKSRLPRRESERKHHHLARYSDILMSVETRLSMLSMTYMKYIEACQCCFIPGKVLDEAFKAIRIVSQNIGLSNPVTLQRPHDFLQEYRDISSMAMEHFDDKIAPSIREKMKLENPCMFFFKTRTGRRNIIQTLKPPHPPTEKGRALIVGTVGTPRTFLPLTATHKQDLEIIVADLQAMRTKTVAAIIETCRRTPVTARPAPATPCTETNGDCARTRLVTPMEQALRVLQQIKAKRSNTDKAVTTLKKKMKSISRKVKHENLLLKQKLNVNKIVMKHMKRELRDTRNAMNVLTKEVNRLKVEQSSSIDSSSKDRLPVGSSLSDTLQSTLSIPMIDNNTSTEKKGMKRKLDSLGES